MCDCFQLINTDLEKLDLALKPVFYLPTANSLTDESSRRISIETVKLSANASSMVLVAKFCPFCGKRYVDDPTRNYGLEQWVSDIKQYGEPEFFTDKNKTFLAKFCGYVTWSTSTYDEYERRDHLFSSSLKFPKTFYLEFAYEDYKKGLNEIFNIASSGYR